MKKLTYKMLLIGIVGITTLSLAYASEPVKPTYETRRLLADTTEAIEEIERQKREKEIEAQEQEKEKRRQEEMERKQEEERLKQEAEEKWLESLSHEPTGCDRAFSPMVLC